MRKRTSWLVLLFVIALVATACASTQPVDVTTTEATTTTADGGSGTTAAPTTTAAPAEPEMKTGRGVDADAKVIKLGLLADLTGPFSPLVIDITDAQQVYWDNVNAAGGLDGWTVELVIEDTNYNLEQHFEKYEKLKDDVVAISQSTGSPTSAAAKDLLADDSMLYIPLSWYSGWAIPEFDRGFALEQNTNYCLEAMNLVHFMKENGAQTVALATNEGDYGGDNGAGVKKALAFYGMDLVYDGDEKLIRGQEPTEVIQGIVGSGADWVYMATSPSVAAVVLGGSVQAGYTGMFTGSGPSYNFALLDSAVGPLYDAVYYQSAYNVVWGEDTPGNNEMMAAMAAAYPDRRPSDSFIIGWNESITMRRVLEAALAALDITPEGVVGAASTLTGVDFGGSAPNQSYSGTPNEYVLRSLAIYEPDLAVYTAAGGPAQTLSQDGATTGSVLIQDFFVGDAAAAYDFTSPCWEG